MSGRNTFTQRLKRSWAALTRPAAAIRNSQRMYGGAQGSRLNGAWSASNTSADTEIAASLSQLRSRSRALCRDVSYAKRAKTLVVNNVIGSGIGMQALVYTSRDELNKRINDDIEEQFCHWSKADSCHTGGRMHFSNFERALMAQVFEAGEVLVRKHYRAFGSSKIPFALELIEAERLSDDITQMPSAGSGNQIRMGVEVDKFYRPVAYYIRTRHPGELRYSFGEVDKVERVPADQIIHLVYGDRWPQTRGEPWMHAVINTFKDVAGYVEAEITRARIQACSVGAIETSEEAASFGEEQPDGSVVMEVEPGTYKRLNPGEKLNATPTNSPNPGLEPFMRYLLRDIAAGVGPSYASLSQDYSQSNYSSSRLSLLDDRDLWRVFQSWFIEAFRKPIHNEWLRQAVLAGAVTTIPVGQYAPDPVKFESVRFRPRGWGWVDPTKEVQAFKDAVRAGFMTQQDVLAASGDDIEELIEQRGKELEMAKAAGLVFDTDPSEVSSNGAAQADPASADPPDPGTPPDDSEQDPAPSRVFRFQRK